MKNRPSSSRIFGAVLALGSMLGLGRTAQATTDSAWPAGQAVGTITPPPYRIHGFGASPDVWGQSAACKRMVRKNFLARRARS